MHVIASFDHSIYLEMAITALEELGIPKERIYAVPLQERPKKPKMFDSINSSDGISLFDAGVALATACTVIGSSYGFILKGGAILWGIIGAVVGFLIGFVIDILHQKRSSITKAKTKKSEVIILVTCAREEAKHIQEVFWEHLAFGVAVCD
ncbi:hypothetical protein BC351_21205 [Paenibacillus ferrarius]|uniref:Uncharacterized protein n=1 Tax=Paenibacillus ferrarius TaxID=1469647 RepID=A0A1V4HNM4_9BACL|nr:hypothetical protein [Paenibacillus ferrarius]OPH59425.1 hypothetical protein BC351_21205 [Paenibacillus ferrarius]